MKLRVSYPHKAVYHWSKNGPSFGVGHDLFVSILSNTNRDSYMNFSSYEFPNEIRGLKVGNSLGEVLMELSNVTKLKYFKFYNFIDIGLFLK